MPKAYRDPTADLAIANVERERKRKAAQGTYKKQKHKPKPERTRYEPVDCRKVLASEHKKVNINKAWAFKAAFERSMNELRQRPMERETETHPET